MPKREDIFTNGEIYHIFNKTIDHKRIFIDEVPVNNFLRVLQYYRSSYSQKLSFSDHLDLEPDIRAIKNERITDRNKFQFDILTNCFMPTHFHFLFKQKKDEGILKGFSNTLNSFVRHYNILSERTGPLFLPRFKSVRIKTEEQLKHVSRYIHLNPYSDGIVKDITEVFNYPFSSLKDYISKNNRGLCNVEYILNLFGGDRIRYKKFVEDNADYQRSLEELKYLEKLNR